MKSIKHGILALAFCVMALWGWSNGFLSRQILGGSKAVISPFPRLTAFVAAGLTIGALIAMAALIGHDDEHTRDADFLPQGPHRGPPVFNEHSAPRTRAGRRQLEAETVLWERIHRAIALVLKTA